jgi:hypothetical protein
MTKSFTFFEAQIYLGLHRPSVGGCQALNLAQTEISEGSGGGMQKSSEGDENTPLNQGKILRLFSPCAFDNLRRHVIRPRGCSGDAVLPRPLG